MRRALVVRQYFPQMARRLGQRYIENRRLAGEIRGEQFCASIKTAARFLHTRGGIPNHKNLKPYLDRHSKLRCDWAINALHEVRTELGYEESSEQLYLPL